MNILGIHAALNQFNHDPGAALISDGMLQVVCEEERFNRVKSARGYFPHRSIEKVLKEAQCEISNVDYIYTTGKSAKDYLNDHLTRFIRHFFGYVPPIEFVDHQEAHLASAFYCSGFEEAMCISYDGVGDGSSGKLAVGKGSNIDVLEILPISNSLGVFYSAATAYLGFRPVEDEYKVMGLASYGKNLLDVSDLAHLGDGCYSINQEYIEDLNAIVSNDQPLYGAKFEKLFGAPRLPGEAITDFHCDIAYTIQKLLESCIVSLVKNLHRRTGLRRLCIAGGVGLNCSANYTIQNLPFIDELYVQPAASDRGLPLGAALIGQIEKYGQCEIPEHLFLGPTYNAEDYLRALKGAGVSYQKISQPEKYAAGLISDKKIIGWFQGRSEYGPRALGNRSILADARVSEMKDLINSRVKFREEFRPFAPAVLENEAQAVFEMSHPSPFMTSTFRVRDQWCHKLPAVTHVDKTARVQTVNSTQNKKFFDLIESFYHATGVPVVLNTSFNARGEPIVETPENALATFFSTGLDALFLGDYLIKKNHAPQNW